MNIEHNRTFFNSRANDWDKLIYHNPEKIKYLLNQLKLKNNDTILDVGTGTGVLIPYLLELTGYESLITAIDLAENMIEKAKEKQGTLPVNFICGDITDYPLPREYFDVIVCYSVFPHFIDPIKVLTKLYTLLKNKGRLLVCHSESKEKINTRHRNISQSLISQGLLPVKETAAMFEQAGFTILDMTDNDELYYLLGQKLQEN